MKTASKKLLSLLLAAVMIATMLPFAAFASEAHVCSAETVQSYPGGYWECSCGKVYADKDCTGEALTQEQYAEQYAQIVSAGAAAQQSAVEGSEEVNKENTEEVNKENSEENNKENNEEVKQNTEVTTSETAQQSAEGDEDLTVSTPAQLGAGDTADVIYVQYALKLGETGSIIAATKPAKRTTTIGSAASLSDFSAGFKANDLSSSDYLMGDFYCDEYKHRSTDYINMVTTNGTEATAPEDPLAKGYTVPNDPDGNPYPLYVFVAVAEPKEIYVTVQVQWKEGSETKTYVIIDEAKIKDRSMKVMNYLFNTGITGLEDVHNSLSTIMNTKCKILDDSSDGRKLNLNTEIPEADVTGFKWDPQKWYVNGESLGTQKLSTNMTVTAKLTADKCHIKFNYGDDGGDGKVKSGSVTTNTSYGKELPVPTTLPDGKIFVGWFSEPIPNPVIDSKTGRVAAPVGVKQYFTNTIFTKCVELHAAYIDEADITVKVYGERVENPTVVAEAKVHGVPKGGRLTTDMVKALFTNPSSIKAGPYNDVGTKDNSWYQYAVTKSGYHNYTTVSAVKDAEVLAVYGPSLTLKSSTYVGENFNTNPGIASINENYIAGNSAYAGNSSTSSADPSNPKTGDAAHFGIPAAQIVLATSSVALMAIAAAAYVQKKKEQM